MFENSILVLVPLDLGPQNSRNRCSKNLLVWMFLFFSGNWLSFGEITKMEGKNSTDCEETVSEIYLVISISEFFIYP